MVASLPPCTGKPRPWRHILGWGHSWDAADPDASTYEGTGADYPDEGTRFAVIPDRGNSSAKRPMERDDGYYSASIFEPAPIPGPLRTEGPWFGDRPLALADDMKTIGGSSLFTSPDGGATDSFVDMDAPVWGAVIAVPDGSGFGGGVAWGATSIGNPLILSIDTQGGFWNLRLDGMNEIVAAVPFVDNQPVLIIWQVADGVDASWIEVNGVRTFGTLPDAATVPSTVWTIGWFARGYLAAMGAKHGTPSVHELAKIQCYWDGLSDPCGFFDDFESYVNGETPPSPPYTESPNYGPTIVRDGALVGLEYYSPFNASGGIQFGVLDAPCQTLVVTGVPLVFDGAHVTPAAILYTSLGYVATFAQAGSGGSEFIMFFDDGLSEDSISVPLVEDPPLDEEAIISLSYDPVAMTAVAHLVWGDNDLWLWLAIDLGSLDGPAEAALAYYSIQPYGTIESVALDCTCLTPGAVPIVLDVDPGEGTADGGTPLTITGSGFLGATSVTLNGVEVASFVVVDDNTITAVSAPGSAGLGAVVVTTPSGTGALGNAWIYVSASEPPHPLAIDPEFGTADGGSAVTITGWGFTGSTSVTLNGVEVTSFIVVDDGTITAVSADGTGAVGLGDVVVTNPFGSGTLVNGWTYYLPAAPTSINPAFGTTLGGTAVTISGTGFTGATGATLKGVAITSFVVVNDTTITGVSGAGTEGLGDVVVTNLVGSGTLANGWTYDVYLNPYRADIYTWSAWGTVVGTTPTRGQASSQLSGGNLTGPGAVNDAVDFRIWLEAGTYTMTLIHVQGSNRGIYTFDIDGTGIGTIDGYSAGGVLNAVSEITGITVSAGLHTVRAVMATKNAGSSAYRYTPNTITFTRTGA